MNSRLTVPSPRPGLTLARVLTPPDKVGAIVSATIGQVNADGTVIVDFGAGRKSGPSRCVAAYTPLPGDPVEVQRRDATSWLVLGTTRTSNATTQTGTLVLRTPYNVRPSTGGVANPLVVSAAATASWRDSDGWSRTQPYQGAYSTSAGYGYWRGCGFYGAGAFAALAGRTAGASTIHMHRHTAIGGTGVGSSAAVSLYLAPHAHATQPSTPPVWVDTPRIIGSMTAGDDLQVADLTIPLDWVQMLCDGKAAGFGLLRLTTADYARWKSVAEDSTSFRLTLGWS